jgi:hypothetical protein
MGLLINLICETELIKPIIVEKKLEAKKTSKAKIVKKNITTINSNGSLLSGILRHAVLPE